jgi:hypothetical protein
MCPALDAEHLPSEWQRETTHECPANGQRLKDAKEDKGLLAITGNSFTSMFLASG